VSVDLGTGDGRLPYTLARQTPQRLFVGIDANVAGLRELSGRSARDGPPNVMYVRASVENLPHELAGVADRVTIILPWGTLLAAVARPCVEALAGVRALCQPEATLSVVLSVAERDLREARRLGLPPMDSRHFDGDLAAGYGAAGFTVTSVRRLGLDQLATWPSTWARRLGHGQLRAVFQVDARASAGPADNDSLHIA
jgi:16S rRNA (adenine(1408)-N(1))-methyltransferase